MSFVSVNQSNVKNISELEGMDMDNMEIDLAWNPTVIDLKLGGEERPLTNEELETLYTEYKGDIDDFVGKSEYLQLSKDRGDYDHLYKDAGEDENVEWYSHDSIFPSTFGNDEQNLENDVNRVMMKAWNEDNQNNGTVLERSDNNWEERRSEIKTFKKVPGLTDSTSSHKPSGVLERSDNNWENSYLHQKEPDGRMYTRQVRFKNPETKPYNPPSLRESLKKEGGRSVGNPKHLEYLLVGYREEEEFRKLSKGQKKDAIKIDVVDQLLKESELQLENDLKEVMKSPKNLEEFILKFLSSDSSFPTRSYYTLIAYSSNWVKNPEDLTRVTRSLEKPEFQFIVKSSWFQNWRQSEEKKLNLYELIKQVLRDYHSLRNLTPSVVKEL